MMAKLDNEGPFQFFFTLSCADKLWYENITSVLEAKNVKIIYEFDDDGNETTLIGLPNESETKWVPIEEYMENEMDISIHELLRRNVVTATRNYNQRVKSFIKEIMTDSSSPFLVRHYAAKLEFQGRGAAHNHGTIWVDLPKMEFMMEKEEEKRSLNPIEYNLMDLDTAFDKTETAYIEPLKDALQLCADKVHPKTLEETIAYEKAKETLISFGKEKLGCKNNNYDEILSRFKFIGLCGAFKKFQTGEDLLDFEEKAVISFAEKFTSVSLCPSVVGEKVANLVKKVNNHRHTKACRKYGTSCRFSFPKYPLWKTTILNSNSVSTEEERSKFKKILSDVGELLKDEDTISKIMNQFDKKINKWQITMPKQTLMNKK